jgi:hypothetical protein
VSEADYKELKKGGMMRQAEAGGHLVTNVSREEGIFVLEVTKGG